MHRLTLPLTLAAILGPACTFNTAGLGTDGGTGTSGTTTVDTTSATTTASTAATETGTGTASATGTTTSTTATTTSTSTTATTDVSTTVAPPACGDGVLNDGEECDQGAMNGNDQACKADCTLNVCGDGHQGPGEGCDDGNTMDGDGCSATCVGEDCGDGKIDPGEECDDNNDTNDDGCTNACTLPKCGDQIKQAGEDCDEGAETATCDADCTAVECGDNTTNEAAGEACDEGGETATCNDNCTAAKCGDDLLNEAAGELCDDGNTADGDGCSATCKVEGLRVFVTKAVFDGDLGGLTGADTECKDAATAAGLGGNWMAWLSDDMNGPATRFTTKGGKPYVRLDGQIVADTWADLLDGSVDIKIDIDENGDPGAGSNFVWTNTTSDGKAKTNNVLCKGWADGAGGSNRGARGNRSQAGQKWTDDGDEKCDQKYHLYCFEQ